MKKSTAKHIVKCPHCGKDVLDHMKECPFCKEKLEPKYANTMDKKTQKRIKIITNVIGFTIAVIIIVYILLIK